MTNNIVVVQLGAPGCGKDTQAALFIEMYGKATKNTAERWDVISTGAHFRRHRREGTALGKLANHYIQQGLLVPNDVTLDMLRDAFFGSEVFGKNALLNGFPRNTDQAKALVALLKEKAIKRTLAGVVYFDVRDDILLERLTARRVCKACSHTYNVLFTPPSQEGVCDHCGGEVVQRHDDTLEVQQVRLAVYQEETSPLIAYYQKRGELVAIDGNRPIDVVYKDFASAVLALVSAVRS
ncbi:MAG: adenylate kinase family protein [Patescibacteria group bacterium]